VIERALREAAARRQSGVAGADDDRRDVFDDELRSGRRPGQATSTVTLVGLVTTSNTAERFCDWATRASMSFLGASASMWKVTLISS
jgi:hypothetical protein